MNYLLPLWFLIFGLSCKCFAQRVTENDFFEGEPKLHSPPPFWNNSGDESSSIDTQPGMLNNYKPAAEGASYISIVTRRLNKPGTVETCWADLNRPFLKDHCYDLRIELSLTKEFFGTLNWTDYYFDQPCVLQVLGFNGECHTTNDIELLWESNPVTEFDWTRYYPSFRPEKGSYERIALRAYFTDSNNYQNSALLVDNLGYFQANNVFNHKNGLLNIPEGASNIKWYFNGKLIPDDSSRVMPLYGNGYYMATFYDENKCLITTTEYIELDYDNFLFYPSPTKNTIQAEFLNESGDVATISLLNEIGQELIKRNMPVEIGINKLAIDVSLLPAASYIIRVNRVGLTPLSSKFIKIK